MHVVLTAAVPRNIYIFFSSLKKEHSIEYYEQLLLFTAVTQLLECMLYYIKTKQNKTYCCITL